MRCRYLNSALHVLPGIFIPFLLIYWFRYRKEFGDFVGLLYGRDLCDTVTLDTLYDKFSNSVAFKTECVVLRSPAIQQLQQSLGGACNSAFSSKNWRFILQSDGILLLPGTDYYIKYIKTLKNPNARQNFPVGIAKPATLDQVQICAKWCYEYSIPISVVGGGHSDHCSNTDALLVSMVNFSGVEVFFALVVKIITPFCR